MNKNNISEQIFYVGVDDKDLDLFESQYVIPNGVSYNSYLIMDEQIALMDTVDVRKTDEWLDNIEQVLQGKKPDYLVVSHMEPDHSGSMKAVAEKYPNMKIVGNAKTFSMLPQFIDLDVKNREIIVKEGETLSLGSHVLQFIMAPMVHWPEVMLEYEQTEKVLFSADAFGKFGALDADEDWACEARRYYFNIVGKYGAPVSALLKKAANLDIQTICPLHGPILKENLSYYMDKYQVWSSYEPEDQGVLIAYASIHGNTEQAARKLAEILTEKGAAKVVVSDLAREDMAEVIEDAFRYNTMILAAASYDGGVFPCMESFLNHLKSKAYQNRKVGILENGSWAPSAGRVMKTALEGMKNITIVEPVVTIQSTMKEVDMPKLEALAEAILQ
ncbi:MAG: FprA family A-type flavoprotein [Lachnospiraceae bacterium]|nr:FprA family A-type flavoprotein [Lachnospiraceae bacterium]MBP3505746.1 FprA family A-type flavoprotein [Lachnospiraceae bacterium]